MSTTDASPQTLHEIRDLMRTDLTMVTAPQLLAILLATGSSCRGEGEGRPERRWTAVQLAYEIYAILGDNLTRLMETGHRRVTSLCRQRFGLGDVPRDRLVAGAWLASPRHMPTTEERPEAELIAIVLGAEEPDKESARRLFEELGGPRELMRSMTVDAFESFRQEGVARVRRPKTDVERAAFYRLVAVVELRARCGGCSSPYSSAPALEPGMFGLKSPELVEVLNPANYLKLEFRTEMIELLRSHPELASDFVKLDRLAGDAQTSNGYHAIEVSLMFEWLCRDRNWSHPSEVLGEKIPYDHLLAIAQAKIARSSGETARVSEIKALLEHAAKAATAEPIDRFIEAVIQRKLPKAFVEQAIDEIRRRCIEPARPPQG